MNLFVNTYGKYNINISMSHQVINVETPSNSHYSQQAVSSLVEEPLSLTKECVLEMIGTAFFVYISNNF